MDLRGRNVLLTGGSRGLGPRIARAMALRGARVALVARSEEPLRRAAAELTALGARAVAVAADLSQLDCVERVVAEAGEALGPIDLLINNAGVEHVSAYADLAAAEIAAMVHSNLLSAMLLTRRVLPGMLERRRGHVVSVASLAGKHGQPYAATYAATKAGMIEWSGALRAELRGSGVGISVVCPGFVSETGMFADYRRPAPAIAGESPPEAVVAAVLEAVTRDRGELLVNPGPARLMVLAHAASPAISRWLFRIGGLERFFREQAAINKR